MKASVSIEFTDEQIEIIRPMIMGMVKGEATLAQVFIDGFRVKVLDAETAKRVQAAIGLEYENSGRNYAFGCVVPLDDDNED